MNYARTMDNIALKIISKFDTDAETGDHVVARNLGLDITTVRRWMYDWKGGTGGLIPSKWQQAVLDLSNHFGAGVEPKDFFKCE